MRIIPPLARVTLVGALLLAGLGGGDRVRAQDAAKGDAAAGQKFFAQNCALCHAVQPGVTQQGPSLAGVVGRRAASANYNYTKALQDSRLTWDAATLDRFLTNPAALVPGTTMPMAVAGARTIVAT